MIVTSRVLREKKSVYEKTDFPAKTKNEIVKCRAVSVLSQDYKNNKP